MQTVNHKISKYKEKLLKISNHRCEFQQKFTLIINVSLHLPKKSYKISKKYCKNKYINFHTFTQETYKVSKNYIKRREKVYRFPYIYSRNIQIL